MSHIFTDCDVRNMLDIDSITSRCTITSTKTLAETSKSIEMVTTLDNSGYPFVKFVVNCTNCMYDVKGNNVYIPHTAIFDSLFSAIDFYNQIDS